MGISAKSCQTIKVRNSISQLEIISMENKDVWHTLRTVFFSSFSTSEYVIDIFCLVFLGEFIFYMMENIYFAVWQTDNEIVSKFRPQGRWKPRQRQHSVAA